MEALLIDLLKSKDKTRKVQTKTIVKKLEDSENKRKALEALAIDKVNLENELLQYRSFLAFMVLNKKGLDYDAEIAKHAVGKLANYRNIKAAGLASKKRNIETHIKDLEKTLQLKKNEIERLSSQDNQTDDFIDNSLKEIQFYKYLKNLIIKFNQEYKNPDKKKAILTSIEELYKAYGLTLFPGAANLPTKEFCELYINKGSSGKAKLLKKHAELLKSAKDAEMNMAFLYKSDQILTKYPEGSKISFYFDAKEYDLKIPCDVVRKSQFVDINNINIPAKNIVKCMDISEKIKYYEHNHRPKEQQLKEDLESARKELNSLRASLQQRITKQQTAIINDKIVIVNERVTVLDSILSFLSIIKKKDHGLLSVVIVTSNVYNSIVKNVSFTGNIVTTDNKFVDPNKILTVKIDKLHKPTNEIEHQKAHIEKLNKSIADIERILSNSINNIISVYNMYTNTFSVRSNNLQQVESMISSLSEYIKEQKSMIIKLDNINIIKVLVGACILYTNCRIEESNIKDFLSVHPIHLIFTGKVELDLFEPSTNTYTTKKYNPVDLIVSIAYLFDVLKSENRLN